MNKIVKNCLAEIVRVLVSALLAAVGLQSTGCIACGDNSTAACVMSTGDNGVK